MRTMNSESSIAGTMSTPCSSVIPTPSLKKYSGRLIGFIRSVAIVPSRIFSRMARVPSISSTSDISSATHV